MQIVILLGNNFEANSLRTIWVFGNVAFSLSNMPADSTNIGLGAGYIHDMFGKYDGFCIIGFLRLGMSTAPSSAETKGILFDSNTTIPFEISTDAPARTGFNL